MAGMLDLPAELITHIVSFLENPDVFNARLSSKHVESSSFSYFGRRFFRKKGYLITTPSLDVLNSIANHGKLRKYVQHVWFNPDCYTFVDPECAPDEEVDDDGETHERVDLLSDDNRRKWDAFMECITDHGRLLSGLKLAENLTDSFSKLPNLVAIGMRRSEDHSPWGWLRLKEVIGQDPRVLGPLPSGPKYTLQAPTKLFIAIIHAVAAAGVRMKRLYTDVVEIDNVLPRTLPQDILDRACRSLLYLEFNATTAWLNNSPRGDYLTAREESEWGEGVLRLIKAVPQVLELGLQIFPNRGRTQLISARATNPEPWRHVYPYITFAKLANEAPLSNLTRLKLEKLTLVPEILLAFMEPSGSRLVSLKMRDIRLLPTTSDKKPWCRIFSFLHNSCPRLSYLLLCHLQHDKGGISFGSKSSAAAMYEPDEARLRYSNAAPDVFVNYDDIALEAKSREEVERVLERVTEHHCYDRPIFSYEMDDGVWHTDTSDEEW